MSRKRLCPIILMIIFLLTFLPSNIQIYDQNTRLNLINLSHDVFQVSTTPESSDPTQDEWPMFRGQLNHTGEAKTTPAGGANPVWSYTTGNFIVSSPTVAGGRLYVGSGDHRIYCLNVTMGGLIWNYTTGDSVNSSPALAGGRVYVGSGDYRIYCLNATTGRLLWTYTTGGSVCSSPAIAGGRVYVGSDDGKVYCLNASSSKVLWNYTTVGPVDSSPAVVSGCIYINSENKMYCLNGTTGGLLWNYTRLSGILFSSSPAVAGGRVFIGDKKGGVVCLNATMGKQLWIYYPIVNDRGTSSLAVANGRLYAGNTDNRVFCLNATTGGLLWRYTTADWVCSSPVVADGRLYVGSNDYKVYCLNATTGRIIWSYTTGNRVYSSPAVAGGHIYIGSQDYKIYCLNAIMMPTAPQYLEFTPKNQQITLTWYPPFYDSGLAITNYNIYRGNASGAETYLTTIGNMLNYNDTGLINGSAYYYKVSAVNGVGESPFSNEVCVIPGPANSPFLLWNRKWGGPTSSGFGSFYDDGPSVAVDSNGSIYCVGTNTTGSVDYLVLTKFFSNGTVVWENKNSILGAGYGVTVDKDGYIYVVGGDDEARFMVVKLFSDGTKAWETRYKITGAYVSNCDFLGVAVDNTGSIYSVGYYNWAMFEITACLAKFFSNGTLAWQVRRDGVVGYGVAVDSEGFIYAAGSDFSLKVTPNGKIIWANGIKGYLGNYFVANGVAIDNGGYIYYAGYNTGLSPGNGLELIKLFPNGTQIWETFLVDSNSEIFGKGVAIDDKGAIYCVGYIRSNGKVNLALFKFFYKNMTWQTIWNDSKQSYGYGVALDSHAAIYCVGYTFINSTYNADFLLLKYTEEVPNLPVMTILEPSNGASFSGGKIWINGTASAGVSHVFQNILINDTRFTNATHLIGENSGDFGFYNTSCIPDGILRINVTSVNEVGQKGQSIVVFTLDNTPPDTAALNYPIEGACLRGMIWINATGVDMVSGIRNLTFYRDGNVLIGTDTTAPYAIQWNTSGLDGGHTLYIRAFDNAGNYRDSIIVGITVNNTISSPPSITSPITGAYVKGTITIKAVAESGIKDVVFYRDANLIIGIDTSAPYEVLWSTAGLDGPHILYVRAFDYANNYLDSAPITLAVDNTSPSPVNVTASVAGSYVRDTIQINATAADAVSGIRNITFYYDAGILIGTDTTLPYDFQWDTHNIEDGTHSLWVRAFDHSGNFLDSAPISIKVDNTQPISASITAPTAWSFIKGTVGITAMGIDAIGIKNITFYRDAAVLLGAVTTSPYICNWNTTTTMDGSHLLYVRVFDNAGNYLDSPTVLITLDNTPPSAAIITSPTAGSSLMGTVSLTALGTDAIGIKNITFYRDTAVLIGADTTSPYIYNWNTSTAMDGIHTLYIRVFDNTGNYRDSAPVSIIVNNTSSTMNIPTAPQNLQATPRNRHITLTWQAPSSDGGFPITNYRIYRGLSLGNESLLTNIGTDLTYIDSNLMNGQPYYYQISAINGMGEGARSIEVQAKPIGKPSPPQNISIIVTNGQIVISWHAPSDNGGDSIISYKIYRGFSSNNETYFITIGNISSFTDTNLVHGRAYYYRVSAVNELGESSWSAEVVGMAYISGDGDQNFGWIIIIILMVGLVGLSGGILYFNRTTKSTAGKIIGLPKAPTGSKGSKSWKYISTGVVEVEDGSLSEMGPHSLWNSLRLRFNRLYRSEKWAQALVLLGTLNEIAEFLDDDEKIKELSVKYEEIRWKQRNLSEMEPESLWNSLMLRFNRLYKSEKWAQALVLLGTLNEIAEFLGDDKKIKGLSAKYDEIKVKRQQNSYIS